MKVSLFLRKTFYNSYDQVPTQQDFQMPQPYWNKANYKA